MALVTGVSNVGKNPAELNARSFAGTILRLFPNGSAPLFALTSQSGKSSAKSATHGYFSKVWLFVSTTITTAIASAGTTNLEVASSTGISVGMVLFFPSVRENVRVTAIVDATNITVTRGFGRTAAQASIADNAVVFQVGTAYEENSLRPTARSINATYIPNYTQIFRNAWALSDTARASLAEQGWSNVAENRKDCTMFHSVDIESAIIWGQPVAPTTGPGGQLIHATQGIIDALEQYAPGNTNAADSSTTYDELIALMEPAFLYSTDMANPKERVLFGDATAIKVINAVGVKSGQVQITQNETQFGMHFTKFKFYKGTVNLVEHPLMNGLGQSGSALIMDMPALKLAYLDGRDTKAEEYGAGGKLLENGIDGVGGSLTTECAVELINPYSCAYVTGLTAAT